MAQRVDRVVLVRHGETAWSLSGQHTGRTDVPLTAHGRRRARAAGRRLLDWTFALVLESPLSRASETCKLAGFGDVAQRRDDLVEWDYGSYEGRTTADIHSERPGWELWRDGCPGGEQAPDVGARVDRVIAQVREVHGNSILFSHGHVLRVLAARWLGLAPQQGRLHALSTATVSVLGYEHGAPVVWLWNDGSHLVR